MFNKPNKFSTLDLIQILNKCKTDFPAYLQIPYGKIFIVFGMFEVDKLEKHFKEYNKK